MLKTTFASRTAFYEGNSRAGGPSERTLKIVAANLHRTAPPQPGHG